MTDKDKEKLHQILSSLWKNDDSAGKTYYNQALQDAQIAIDSLQEEPVDYDRLNTMLDDALSKETKDSWNERLDKDEEPINEDLGEYINELSKQFPEVSFAKLSRIAVRVAKWQKQKDDGEIKMVRELLADFDKHCDEYHEAGFKHGQEALMKDVIDAQVVLGPNNNHVLMNGLFNSYKYHDKVKVALIKED